MFRKALIVGSALVALVSAGGKYEGKLGKHLKQKDPNADCCEIKEFKSPWDHRRIHLVNLDDERQISDLEEFGLCINIGDMVFVTGLEHAAAG